MIANMNNDHEFISVVDLRNLKASSVEGGSTTDYRGKETTAQSIVESPCVVNIKSNPSMKLTQSNGLHSMNKTLQKSNTTKLSNNLNAFQDKVVALM